MSETTEVSCMVSSYWFSYGYGTDYGIEHFILSSPTHFAKVLKRIIEKYCDNEPCDLGKLTEYYEEEEGFLPYEVGDAEDCIRSVVNKFVNEIDGFDDELSMEALLTLENICTEKKEKTLAEND